MFLNYIQKCVIAKLWLVVLLTPGSPIAILRLIIGKICRHFTSPVILAFDVMRRVGALFPAL